MEYEPQFQALLKDNLTIVQITDTHLFAEDTGALFGINSNAGFYSVLEKIKQDSENEPDLFLLTGDLSQDETEISYQRLVDALTPFNIPVFWISGNHDNIEMMTQVFSQSSLFHRIRHLQLKNFDFIFLNTKLDGTDDGYLSEGELKALDVSLKEAQAQEKKIIIVMHHHPIKTQTPLIDQYILRNVEVFWGIVNQYSYVQLVICGHVHGDYQLKQGNVTIEAAPATCLQWKKGTTELSIERKIGYKLYKISSDNYQPEARLFPF